MRRAGQALVGACRRQGQAEALWEGLASSAAQPVQSCVVEGAKSVSTLIVKQRMKSVANIQKITKAMKMVAASKMRRAQEEVLESRGMVRPLLKLLGDQPNASGEKSVFTPITTDKGLCGGINSTVVKYTRAAIKAVGSEDSPIVVVGEKGRAQLQRDLRSNIYATVLDVGKARISYPQASAIAEELLKTEYDVMRLVYNRFVSAISYKPTIATVLSPDALEREAEAGSSMDAYELEGPDRPEMLQDLAELQLATTLYNCMLENNCSEQSSRMSAMENSTKNAGEMLGKLTLTYNRTRQATITTELIEIISGATALEG